MDPLERSCSDGLARPHGYEPLSVEGHLPVDLKGTLFRVGPGKFDSFGRRYAHLFEADGAITAVRIAHGQAQGACRMLATYGLLEEQSKGGPIYGSPASWFSRMINVHRRRIKNTGNTNVMMHGGELLALMEAGRPTRIDPATLATRGETRFDGALTGPFTAHPHRVPARKSAYGYGVRFGRETTLEVYALPDDAPVKHLLTLPLNAPPMLHDFAATEKYLVFFVPPAQVSLPKMLLQLGSFSEVWEWRPAYGTEVIVIPIDDPDGFVRFKTHAFFQWHFANAFDDGEMIAVDFFHYPDFSSFDAIGQAKNVPSERGGSYTRATVDPKRQTLSLEKIFDVPADFPQLHPGARAKRHQRCWLMTEETPQRLVCLDTTNGGLSAFTFESHERACETLLAPTGETETAAYALTLVYDARKHRSALAVFEAGALAGGPIARAWFDHHVPITFHGVWSPAA